MTKNNELVPRNQRSTAQQRIRSMLCSGILFLTLLIVGILAIPACLFIGLIGLVWNTADKIVNALEC